MTMAIWLAKRLFASPLALLLLLTAMSPTPGQSAELAAEPVLRIEAGMHTARINHIAIDAAGRYAATASFDKTARVWDIASGQLLRVLRPPLGDFAGAVYAVALTPDGETVAVAGLLADPSGQRRTSIYLFERSTGRVRQRIADVPDAVLNLSFSRDGRWLAAAVSNNGVSVWDWRTGGPRLADGDFKVTSLYTSWGADNRLAASALDGVIRLYRVQADALVKLVQTRPAAGQVAFGLAFTPDGRELAVTVADNMESNARVRILDGQRLTLVHAPLSAGAPVTAIQVAWSADGRSLYASGSASVVGVVRVWPDAGRGAPEDLPTGLHINDMAALPQRTASSGDLLVAAEGSAWGVFDAAGRWKSRQTSPTVVFARGSTEFRLSEDAREVQFEPHEALFEPYAEVPLRFPLASRQLKAGVGVGLLAPRTDGLPIEGLRSFSPTLAGVPLKWAKSVIATSLSIAPDKSRFVLGSNIGSLICFNSDGKELWSRIGADSVSGVNISSSGKLLVAAYADGSIRWRRMSDGQELLALFPHADRKRWVLWTPSGYYDASPGGEELIGWHVNRVIDQAADFFPASRFRDRFYRPDIIDRVLDTLDEGQAVAAADAARGTRAETVSIAQVLPPVVELLSPAELLTDVSQLTLSYRTRSAADAPVTAIRVRINGQAAPDARNLVPVPAGGDIRQSSLSLPPQDSLVQLFAENRHGVSTPATIQVKWKGAAPQAAVPAPALYVLAIGVAKYQHKDISKLNFAAKDARDFAAALQQQEGKLYRSVKVKLITDDDATRDNITSALDWLRRQVTEHDVGMLFLSGHGFNDARGYTFLPVNADPSELLRTGVTRYDITGTLQAMSGKRIVFLDTCHSGNVMGGGFKAPFNDMTGIVNELVSAENGVVVFASSTGRQYSLERADWNNGAFTKAVIEGLAGGADFTKSGRVTHRALAFYVSEKVKQLTNGEQASSNPTPADVPDFPLAAVR